MSGGEVDPRTALRQAALFVPLDERCTRLAGAARVNVSGTAYIPTMTRLQRWLDLIVYLVGHRLPVTVEELMERLPAYAEKWRKGNATDQATARRTFERDKDELRHLGIPIQTVPYSINFG